MLRMGSRFLRLFLDDRMNGGARQEAFLLFRQKKKGAVCYTFSAFLSAIV